MLVAVPSSQGEETEWKTRQTRINKRLVEAGWGIVRKGAVRPARFYQQHALEEYPTDNGPADYALCADGGVVGIVEAKKLSLGPQNVLVQAERYARGVSQSPFNFRGLRVAFLYSTNGEVIWLHDVRDELNAARRVARFHTPNALRELSQRDVETAGAQLHCDRATGYLSRFQSQDHRRSEALRARSRAKRVERAMTKIVAGQPFTDEQRQWLDRIRAHLAENLSITADDFHIVPVFTREGGWRRANRVFGGKLEELLGKINEAVAA